MQRRARRPYTAPARRALPSSSSRAATPAGSPWAHRRYTHTHTHTHTHTCIFKHIHTHTCMCVCVCVFVCVCVCLCVCVCVCVWSWRWTSKTLSTVGEPKSKTLNPKHQSGKTFSTVGELGEFSRMGVIARIASGTHTHTHTHTHLGKFARIGSSQEWCLVHTHTHTYTHTHTQTHTWHAWVSSPRKASGLGFRI